jgi:S1/P1 Nuclease
MRFRWIIATAAILTIVDVVPARAWGPEGHAMVADIAEAHLTTVAAADVAQLLALEGHHDLVEIASWADAIRPTRKDTADWHFVDIPLTESSYDPDRDCAGGNCVVAKILDFTKILANPSVDPQARLEALKCVVHFVGDVHQPLHAENHGDRGGNDIHLTYYGKSTNLHSIWDGAIIEHATGMQLGPHFSIDSVAVAAQASKLDAAITGAQRQEWASRGMLNNLQATVIAWAIDSHAIAKNVAYLDLPAQRTDDWPDAYQAQAWPVVQVQLERAEVRLAEVLNEALK